MHSGVHACDAMETEASGQRTDAIRGKPGARNWTEVPHYNAEIERLFSLWEAPAASCQGGKLMRAANMAADHQIVDIQPDLHGPVKVARGHGFIRARAEDVLNMLIAVERRPEWDDLCDYASKVKQLGENSDIAYLSYQGKLGVCARDLCLLRAWQERSDGSIVLVATSIESDDVPRVAGKVRAECHDCAYMVTPTDDGCTFSYVIQLDMKGYVPLFFTNLIQTQHPLIITMLRRHLEGGNAQLIPDA